MLLTAARGQVLVVDLQERLLPAIAGSDALVRAARLVLAAAGRLGVPVTVSEQYPQGLGATVAGITAALPQRAAVLPKITFSCLAEPALSAALGDHREAGRDQLVVMGCEAHVCVLQSALAARAGGFQVIVVADATASRHGEDRAAALQRARDGGCIIATAEMIVFEWLERAGTDDFRALAPQLRQR